MRNRTLLENLAYMLMFVLNLERNKNSETFFFTVKNTTLNYKNNKNLDLMFIYNG